MIIYLAVLNKTKYNTGLYKELLRSNLDHCWLMGHKKEHVLWLTRREVQKYQGLFSTVFRLTLHPKAPAQIITLILPKYAVPHVPQLPSFLSIYHHNWHTMFLIPRTSLSEDEIKSAVSLLKEQFKDVNILKGTVRDITVSSQAATI